MSRREFTRAYRAQLDQRDETEIAIHGALARTFARQQRRVEKRLRSIRRDLIAQQPTLTPSDTRPADGRHEPVVPQLRASEVFMDGFDDTLSEEVGPVLSKHAALIGGALVGTGIWASAAAQRRWQGRLDAQVGRLRYVGDQSLTVVESTLMGASQAGDTFDTMAGAVGATFDRLAGRTAGFIARVESVALYGGVSVTAAQAAEIPVRKQWLTQEDERVRPTHEDAHGQIVELDDQFQVGEDSLDYPGDPNGAPEETANCRCFLAYVSPDGDVQDIEETAPEG